MSDAAGWQTIETAPRNVLVLLYCPDRCSYTNRKRVELGYASHGWENDVASNISYHSWATHWMPLPAPPFAESLWQYPQSAAEPPRDRAVDPLVDDGTEVEF